MKIGIGFLIFILFSSILIAIWQEPLSNMSIFHPNKKIYILFGDHLPHHAFELRIFLLTLIFLLFIMLFVYYNQLRSIQQKNKNIESILATATDGIHIHDLEGNLLQFSDSFAEMLGYTRDEMRTFVLTDWVVEYTLDELKEYWPSVFVTPMRFETQHRRKDGSIFDTEVFVKGFMLDGKQAIFASSRDISERKKHEVTLLQHQTIFGSIAEGVYAVDVTYRCTYINKAALIMLGLEEDDVIGKIPHEVFHARHDDPLETCPLHTAVINNKAAWLEEIFIRSNGELFPASIVIAPIFQNTISIGAVITFSDITEQKKYQHNLMNEKERYNHMAHHDLLTGLPNRLSLMKMLHEKTSDLTPIPFAFMFLDLDGFKEINDSYGHRFGDKLLIQIAKLMKEIFPDDTFIARTGGDEFVIILMCHLEHDMVTATMNRLITTLNYPLHIESVDVYITASVGIAMYPENTTSVDMLFQEADAAMYNAKKMGKNTYSFYHSEFTEQALHRTTLATDLKLALAHGELTLYFQPQIDSSTGVIVGAESLIRWFTSNGSIPPSIFIPIAEETGLILEIGEFVLHEGFKTAVRWTKKGVEFGHLAINVSARQLIHPNFLNLVESLLHETQCNPAWIELEITEGSILENPKYVTGLLEVLKMRGFYLSMDDFGTGYSSLSYLKNLPIDKLKIDLSFVRHINNQIKNQTIIRTIIALAKGLHLNIIAEGVEDKDELDFLQDNGVDLIQGFYYHKPMTREAFEILCETNTTRESIAIDSIKTVP